MKSASQNVQWEKWAAVTGQWVWLFHYCGENDQRYISCMSAPTACFFKKKSRTNENWVRTCLQVLSPTTGLRNVWWRKRYCLWLNNTGSTETEELGFYSGSVHTRKQLLAIDVFLHSYCYCRLNAETRGDLFWKWIRISDDPNAIMTPTSSRCFYVHRAYIHSKDELVTSHWQKKRQ